MLQVICCRFRTFKSLCELRPKASLQEMISHHFGYRIYTQFSRSQSLGQKQFKITYAGLFMFYVIRWGEISYTLVSEVIFYTCHDSVNIGPPSSPHPAILAILVFVEFQISSLCVKTTWNNKRELFMVLCVAWNAPELVAVEIIFAAGLWLPGTAAQIHICNV